MQGGRRPRPDHPITVEPARADITVRIAGMVVARSGSARVLREADLPPVYYFPREDVAMAELAPGARRTHCPYKGDASYFGTRDGTAKDVAWSYEDPFDHMLAIKGCLAFYPDRVDAIETEPHARTMD